MKSVMPFRLRTACRYSEIFFRVWGTWPSAGAVRGGVAEYLARPDAQVEAPDGLALDLALLESAYLGHRSYCHEYQVAEYSEACLHVVRVSSEPSARLGRLRSARSQSPLFP